MDNVRFTAAETDELTTEAKYRQLLRSSRDVFRYAVELGKGDANARPLLAGAMWRLSACLILEEDSPRGRHARGEECGSIGCGRCYGEPDHSIPWDGCGCGNAFCGGC